MASEYAFFEGTIGELLSVIINGYEAHDYVIIPESCYEDWKKLTSFVREDICGYEIDRVHVHRKAIFEEEGHAWEVESVNCVPPRPEMGLCWRFIVSIDKDKERLMTTRTAFSRYLEHIKELCS